MAVGIGNKANPASTPHRAAGMRLPITNNSRPGQAIYDPFLGSGTSLIAAEMTGCICCGVEELCRKLGDELDQAAWLAGNTMTSMPFWNLMPWTIFGNWFSPFNRRHVFAAALTSLNTMSLAVLADRDPLVRMVR